MIFIIRGQKVMLDIDLAELYGVETKSLNRSVKRNTQRFPKDFMFELNSSDLVDLRYQIGTSNLISDRIHIGHKHYVFTENGVAMLSGILNSDRAISVNISIMRTFTKMRALLASSDVVEGTDKLFKMVFERLDTVEEEIQEIKKESPRQPVKRKRIGLMKD